MNLTISVDAQVLERARALAHGRGTSVQDLIREYLQSLAGEQTADEVADELLDLMESSGGRSGGRSFRRADAYEGRLE